MQACDSITVTSQADSQLDMEEDDEEEQNSEQIKDIDILYQVFLQYSQDFLISQRVLRPNKNIRNRNMFNRFTFESILDNSKC